MIRTLPVSDQLLTVADYAALEEDERLRHVELLEGVLAMVPAPTPDQMLASGALYKQVDAQLPPDLVAIYEVDLDLQLAPPDQPGTVRRPDLVVVTRDEAARVKLERGILQASGAVLVVEIVSAGSRRSDQLIKRAEYADAGIPHYWIVELEPAVSLTACALVDGGYRDDGPHTGQVRLETPFPIELNLTALA